MRTALALLLATTAQATIAPAAEATWPAKVSGFVAPKPGEHPRLLFRRADVAALRARAATPEGKAILARLRTLLGGGETMPEHFCQDKPVNNLNEGAVRKQPVGTFTMSHGAGFGLLYVLTGERKYADLARQCVDKIFEGQVDRDSRYNWKTPGTGFRCSFVLQGICLAYDLCADAWPADYRERVVRAVLNMKQRKVDKDRYYTLESLAAGGGYPPGSNHFGAYILGPGLAALTFRGERGADDKRLDAVLETVEKGLRRVLGEGFGDHGWFAEGTSCGRIAANNGVLPLMQSLKVAAGKDYVTPRPSGRYTVLHLMHTIVPTGKSMDEKRGKYYPVPSRPLIPHRGDYGDNDLYKRPILSHVGDFAEGMGAVLPREAEAMAWIYDHFVQDDRQPRTYNADYYPHLAVYAFVNWPGKSLDPDDVLPKVMVDDIHGYYVARSRWQDKDDILVTTLLKRGPHGYKSGKVRAGTFVWGLGEKMTFGGLRGKTSHFRAAADGSMELADENGNALAVDFSGASGAPAVVAAIGPVKPISAKKACVTALKLGDATVTILTLSAAAHPTPTVTGGAIAVGKQTLKLDGGRLTLGQFVPSQGRPRPAQP